MSNSLVQVITKPTRVFGNSATLIDHIFVKYNLNNKYFAGSIEADISDHYPTFILLHKSKFTQKEKPKYIMFRKLNEGNIQKLSRSLYTENWTDIQLSCQKNDPNLACDTLIAIYTNKLNEHIPVVKTKFNKYKHKLQPWVTKGILKSIHTRDSLNKTKNMHKSAHNFIIIENQYKNYRNLLKRVIRLAESRYWDQKFVEAKNNMKSTWANIKSILNKKRKNTTQTTFLINGKKVTNPRQISNGFNAYFSNIGAQLAKNISSKVNFKQFLSSPAQNTFFMSDTDAEEIIKVVSKMKAKTSASFDDISTKLMKQTIHLIANPLCNIFNCMVKTGVFPSAFKVAKVLPLHKGDSDNLFTNYRPISLLPAFSKVFERLIYNRMYSFLVKFSILFSSQYGFRKHFSTEHALLELTNRIANALDNKYHASSIFIDLSKAFDTLDHSILLTKLSNCGFRGIFNDLILSYLSERKQSVLFNGVKSEFESITCGVPQGSILGPLLFLIYMNDIANSSSIAKFILFADDTSLFFESPTLSELNTLMNSEFKLIKNWMSANKLSLNISKTKFMVFSNSMKHQFNHENYIKLIIDKHTIENVSNFKFLGTWLDNNLNWKINTNEKCKKISQVLGIMYRIKHFISTDILKLLYNSLIQPHLLYGILAWYSDNRNNSKNTTRLSKLQKRAMRIIDRANYNAHTEPIFKKYKILKLHDLYLNQGNKLIQNLKMNQCPEYLKNAITKNNQIHSYNTRKATNIHIVNIRTEI